MRRLESYAKLVNAGSVDFVASIVNLSFDSSKPVYDARRESKRVGRVVKRRRFLIHDNDGNEVARFDTGIAGYPAGEYIEEWIEVNI